MTAEPLPMQHGRQGVRFPSRVVAYLLALGLVACGQGSPDDGIGTEIDRAIDDSSRSWEQVARITDEDTHRAADTAERAMRVTGKAADAALSARVKSALTADPGLKGMVIDVNAFDGAVTLHGAADTAALRATAARVALTVDGVRSVTNHLIVLRAS